MHVRPRWLTCSMADDAVVIKATALEATALEATVLEATQIARVSALVGELARCDVSSLSQEDFLTAHHAVARLGRLTDTLEARFAGDLARRSAPDQPGGGLARRQGFGNAGTMLARLTGGSRAGALRSIEAGKAFMSEVAPV